MLLMTVKQREVLKKYYGEKEWARIEKTLNPKTPKEEKDQMLRMILGNQLVKLKRIIRKEVDLLEKYLKDRHLAYKELNKEKTKTFKNSIKIQNLTKFIKEVDEAIDTIHKNLDQLAPILITFIENYNRVATAHDFAQIIGANMKDIEKYRKDFEETNIDKNKSFFLDLVFVYKAEARSDDKDNKYFIRDFTKTPFFECIFTHMMMELKRNRKLKQKTDEILEDLFPEIRGMQYIIEKDKEGNIVKIEKYYPPLKPIK